MSLKERSEENLESEEISAALTDYLEDMGGQLLDEARQGPEFELTPKADKRLARTLRHNLHKRNPVHLWRRKFVLAAIALLLFLSAVHASAIRSAITNFFINRQEESIDFSELREPDNQTWLTNISLPSFIPQGMSWRNLKRMNKSRLLSIRTEAVKIKFASLCTRTILL